MIFDTHDIDGICLENLSGNIVIKTHDKNEISILCTQNEKLYFEEKNNILNISYNKDKSKVVKKNFVEKIFKRSFKLNLPINSSYIEDRDEINIFPLLSVDMEIYVPSQLIECIYAYGNMNISGENFSNYLKVYSVGKNKINIEKTKNIYVDAKGELECFLNESNNVCIYIIGSAFLKVKNKEIHSLKLKSKGNMDADVVGTVLDFNCELIGLSNVDIFGKVINKQIKNNGICKVSITS